MASRSAEKRLCVAVTSSATVLYKETVRYDIITDTIPHHQTLPLRCVALIVGEQVVLSPVTQLT